MRNSLLPCVALLALSAPPAWAAGISLGWNDCPGGATYSLTKTFACDTNLGTHTLVGSFTAPAGVEAMSANETAIILQTNGNALPDWWKFGAGTCRSASLSGSAAFSSAGLTQCLDYWQDHGVAPTPAYDVNFGAANRARIRELVALPAGDPQIGPLTEGTEVYSFKININSAATVGPGACAGCGDEACIVLQFINVLQPPGTPGGSFHLTNPAPAFYAIWQAWTNPDPANACPAVTPARQQTWGSIKAVYR